MKCQTLTVWPNPAKDFINFQISFIDTGYTTVSLVDIRGRKVFKITSILKVLYEVRLKLQILLRAFIF